MAAYLYVSLQDDDLIARYDLNRDTGGLTNRVEFPLAGMPAPLAADPERRFLFVGRRRPGEFGMTSFRIAADSGDLERISDIDLAGNPVHVSTDRTGKYLLSAYYYQARVGVHGFGDDGALDPSPIEWRETGIGAHYVQTDASNRYAFVPHIAEGSQTGPNAIFQFHFDAATGHLAPNSPDRAVPNAPEGPRHVCFHPNLDVVYSSNEQGMQRHRLSVRPGRRHAGAVPDCAHAAGRVRGAQHLLADPDNAVGPFPVRAQPGAQQRRRLRGGPVRRPPDPHRSRTATEPVPRAFSLDTTGNYLYASGLESGRLASYRVNPDRGALEPLEVYDIGQGPMWVLPIDL